VADRPPPAGRTRRLRRARSLALHLDGFRLVAEDFLAHRRYEINDDALALLKRFGAWRDAESVVESFAGYTPDSVRRSIGRLLARGLLVAEGSEASERQEPLADWAAWSPAATYFHFATRGDRFARTRKQLRAIIARITRAPMPSIYKEMTGPRLPLRRPSARLAPASLGRALLSRRTCREFLSRPLPLRQLEAVTSLTFGRTGTIDGGPYGRLLHRASPSGGARHPIECYVIVLDVRGLERGLYHFDVRGNALVRLPQRATRGSIARFTCGQGWFADAAAVFVLTAVWARTMWKYRSPRAYRVVLIDAAHACQNLLLTATSLGLGAFSVAAIDEDAIDRYLGIDGVSEGSVYVAGIGRPDTARIRQATRGGLLPGAPA
jgi:SagB-type dehydrogenase family enzyme